MRALAGSQANRGELCKHLRHRCLLTPTFGRCGLARADENEDANIYLIEVIV
jgi:hypothetical protein